MRVGSFGCGFLASPINLDWIWTLVTFAGSIWNIEPAKKNKPQYPQKKTMIKLKRVYERQSKGDGIRMLVERLWPRGITKERASVDLWLKDVAPSTELRKGFGHDPAKWEQFRERYAAELKQNKDAVNLLKQKCKEGTITLVYAARDEKHNSAVALKEILEQT